MEMFLFSSSYLQIVCIWGCEQASFCVEFFMCHIINLHSFIHSNTFFFFFFFLLFFFSFFFFYRELSIFVFVIVLDINTLKESICST